MPEPANSYAKIPSQQQTFYDRNLLERLLKNLVFLQHGQKNKKPIPKNEGATINFRRFNSLPIPTESLTEGVTPAGKNISVSQIEAKVKQEGDYVEVTDLLDLMGYDPVITEMTEVQGEQAAETLETRCRDIIFNGTNVYYVGGGVSRDTINDANILSGAEVRRIRQIMARNNVKPVSGAGAYLGWIHPDGAYDLKGSDEWQEPNYYAGANAIFNGEIGKLYGIRWIETTMCPIWEDEGDNDDDVYGALVVGANAYGVVDVAGSAKPEVIVKSLGSSGTADPLNQRSTIGWKALFTSVRLNELCLLRVEHGSEL